jgi:hypothetical protein
MSKELTKLIKDWTFYRKMGYPRMAEVIDKKIREYFKKHNIEVLPRKR